MSPPISAATGSREAKSGACCEELPPSVNANPGNWREELLPSVPESNPIRIATAQTTIAVIHTSRVAARPASLTSDGVFTMTAVSPATEFWKWGIPPRRPRKGGQMRTLPFPCPSTVEPRPELEDGAAGRSDLPPRSLPPPPTLVVRRKMWRPRAIPELPASVSTPRLFTRRLQRTATNARASDDP